MLHFYNISINFIFSTDTLKYTPVEVFQFEVEGSLKSNPIDNFDNLKPWLADWEKLFIGIPWILTSGEIECCDGKASIT
jgi:hypothetical protein